VHDDLSATFELSSKSLTLALGDTAGGDIRGCGVLEERERVAFEVAISVVVGDDAECALGGCVANLDTEGADTTVDKGNFAYEAFGEVRLQGVVSLGSCEIWAWF
jgi:hypothetical protein